MIKEISMLFLIFMIYSVAGWTMETVGGLLKQKKFVNRGFLIGPYCPIYGCGVVLITLLLSRYQNDLIVLFALSMLVCGILEYMTSYVMEKIFDARWWDYKRMKFNINGRICLETLTGFAIGGVIIVKLTNPVIFNILERIPDIGLEIIACTLFIVYLVDSIISFNIILSVKNIATGVSKELKDNTEEISIKVRQVLNEKSKLHKRLMKAFPRLFIIKMIRRKEGFEKVKDKAKVKVSETISDLEIKIEAKKKELAELQEKFQSRIKNTKEK